MIKHDKSETFHRAGRRKLKTAQGIPLIVFLWTFGLGVLSYVGSRFVVTEHPLHWASLAGGLLLGAVIGTLWYLTRGDVGLF